MLAFPSIRYRTMAASSSRWRRASSASSVIAAGFPLPEARRAAWSKWRRSRCCFISRYFFSWVGSRPCRSPWMLLWVWRTIVSTLPWPICMCTTPFRTMMGWTMFRGACMTSR